jgi:broad specificity phosphatase PhoE
MHLIQTKNRYYLMRHGESVANRQGLIVSAPENALNGFGLTNQGSQQVMKAALNTRLDCETIIVSSDYRRALETAEIVKSVIDIAAPIATDSRLRERDFGNYELLEHRYYDDVWQNDISHPGESKNSVESVLDTLARGLETINSLDQRYSDKTILLVGHGDVLQILLAHYHQINPRFHRSLSSLGNADIRSLAKLNLVMKSSA